MPQTLSTPAISLRSRPWRENDALVDVFTLELGKLSLLVRGARRPSSKMAAHLEPLTLLELMVIEGKGIPTAAAASSRNCYPLLKADYDKIAATGWAIGHLNRLMQEGEKDEELFHLITDFCALMNEGKAESAWYQWFAKIFLCFCFEKLGLGTPFKQIEYAPKSLYEAATHTHSKEDFKIMNRRLDTWLRASLENAV